MKKYLGVCLLILMAPILLCLVAVQAVSYGISSVLLIIYNVIYFPIYNIAGKPFDQEGEWKWNRKKY